MSDAKSAWSEAADRLGQLGGKVKHHYDEQHRHEAAPAGGEAAGAGEGAPEYGTPPPSEPAGKVNETANKLAQVAKDAAAAISAAAKDPAVKDDLKQAGQSLAGAVNVTSREVSQQAQQAWTKYNETRPRSKGAPQEPPVTPPTAQDPPYTPPPAPEPPSTPPPAPPTS